MNLTMPHPVSYPFYMDSPRLRFSLPWPSNPFQYQPRQYYSSSYQLSPSLKPMSYPFPFILPHQPHPNPPSKPMHSYSSYTNTRYNHLKQSTSHMNRHRSVDASLHAQHCAIPNHQYQPSKAKSISDIHQLSNQKSTHLLKAHSWHSINHLPPSNINMNYAKEMPSMYDNRHYNHHHHHNNHHHHHHHHSNNHNHEQHQHLYSPKQMKKIPKLHLSTSSPIQKQTPERGIVRISTLDEMPIIHNPIYKENVTLPNVNNKNKTKSNRKIHTKKSSSSSTNSSHSSFQKLLNGTLRHDPLLTAAMEDFRQLHRTSTQSTPLTPHHRDLSRDSLCSESTCHSPSSSSSSSSPSSSSLSHSRSQSSFTSLERLEIRRLIKTLKTNGVKPLNIPIQTSPNPLPTPAEQILDKRSSSIIPILHKPEKSSITEELEREFNKIRSNNPNQELIYVKPSQIHKLNKADSLLPSEDKLILQKQIESIDAPPSKQIDDNPITSIPISQSTPKQSSEIVNEENTQSESKSDYAIPIKKIPDVNLRITKKEEQIRSFSFCKPIHDIDDEIRQTRPLSMFNWLHCGITNQLPTTFQPNKMKNNKDNNDEYDKSLVKENIYASDIDVHIPLSNDKDYLNDQSIMKDYFTDYKQTANSSSILNDFSRLFTRFGNHKHEHKGKSKRKLHKNNNNNNNNNNSRCSIM